MANCVVAWCWRAGELLRPGESFGLPCGPVHGLRDLERHLRVSFRCLQLDVRDVSAADRGDAGSVRRTTRRTDQHLPMEHRFVWSSGDAKHRRLLCGTAVTGRG